MPRSAPTQSQSESSPSRKHGAAYVRGLVQKLTGKQRRVRARAHLARAELAAAEAEREVVWVARNVVEEARTYVALLDSPSPRRGARRYVALLNSPKPRHARIGVLEDDPPRVARGMRYARIGWLVDEDKPREVVVGFAQDREHVRVRRVRRGVRCLACGDFRTGIDVRDPCVCGEPAPQRVERASVVVQTTPRDLALSRANWHRARAEGQRARFADAEHCGEGEIVSACVCGGPPRVSRVRCGVHRLCTKCHDRKVEADRRRFWGAWVRYRERLELAGVMSRGWKDHEGRLDPWRQRHVILTAPHDRPRWFTRADGSRVSGDAAAVEWRIGRMFRAWPLFVRKLQAWCRAQRLPADGEQPWAKWSAPVRDGGIRPVFWRWFEWTEGADELGHPHFHVWFCGPFLDVEVVREWWTAALEAAYEDTPNERGSIPRREDGRSLINVQIVDADARAQWSTVREIAKGTNEARGGGRLRLVWDRARGGRVAFEGAGAKVRAEDGKPALHDYIGGWSVDLSGNTDPEIQAAVFEALEGRRQTQGAAGFLGLHPERLCECEACGGPRVEASREVVTWSEQRRRAAEARAEDVRAAHRRDVDDPAPAVPPVASPWRSGWVPAAFEAACEAARGGGPSLEEWLASLRGEPAAPPKPDARSPVRKAIVRAVKAARVASGASP